MTHQRPYQYALSDPLPYDSSETLPPQNLPVCSRVAPAPQDTRLWISPDDLHNHDKIYISNDNKGEPQDQFKLTGMLHAEKGDDYTNPTTSGLIRRCLHKPYGTMHHHCQIHKQPRQASSTFSWIYPWSFLLYCHESGMPSHLATAKDGVQPLCGARGDEVAPVTQLLCDFL